MRFFYDTEFVIRNGYPHLLSFGMVAEDEDTPALYITRELGDLIPGDLDDDDFETIGNLVDGDPFVREQVIPNLRRDDDPQPTPLGRFGDIILGYVRSVGDDDPAELWADTGAYDHVALASTFGDGAFQTYPRSVLPYATFDVQQEIARVGLPDQLLATSHMPHRALEDAIATRLQWQITQTYDVLVRMLGADKMRRSVSILADTSDYRRLVEENSDHDRAELLMSMLFPLCMKQIPQPGVIGKMGDAFKAFRDSWTDSNATETQRILAACRLFSHDTTFQYLWNTVPESMFVNTWGYGDDCPDCDGQ